jgi:hypothetical protein
MTGFSSSSPPPPPPPPRREHRDQMCNTLFVQLQIWSWTAGVKFPIPPSR